MEWTATDAPTGRWILERTRKFQNTNINTATLAIRVPDYVENAFTLPEAVSTIYALLDDDGDFSAGTTEIPLTLNGAYREGTVSFDSATPYLTFATAQGSSLSSQTPGGVSTNLVFWTKSDDAGCAPGSACASWKDNSPNANPIEKQGTMTLQPANAVHNFQPYFSNFSSSNYFRDSSSYVPSNTNTQPQSVFTIVRPTQTNGIGRILSMDNGSVDGAEPAFDVYQGRQHLYNYAYSSSFSNSVSANSYFTNQSNLMTRRLDTNYINQRLNGSGQTSTAAYTNRVTGRYLKIGYSTYSDSAGAFPGDISEVIIYDQNLSDNDTQKIESYLALKYGISLDQTSPRDYLSSNGTTKMRDASLAGSYKNDIAGIGRDYASALNQKQSTSANGDILTIGLGEIASSNQANSSTFSSDHSFLTWAHNGASTATWSGANTPDTYFSLPRIYQVQKV
jgi:hypothetical protein